MQPQIGIKSYRTSVLGGNISGRSLTRGLQNLIRKLHKSKNFDGMVIMNNSLLWHLAHCPKVSDREKLIEAAEEFEGIAKASEDIFRVSREASFYEPIPFSPMQSTVRFERSVWLESFFAAERVPSYKKFSAAGIGDKVEARNMMNAALAMRGRVLTRTRGGRLINIFEERVDSFSIYENEEEHVWSFRMFLDTTPTDIAKTGKPFTENNLNLLFIKNGMPVGYGTSAYAKELNPGIARIRVHIFKEFRGTPSSSNFFNALMLATQKELGVNRYFVVLERDAREASLARENTKASMRFYYQHGFTLYNNPQLAGTILVKT